jgi:hypothetical protein
MIGSILLIASFFGLMYRFSTGFRNFTHRTKRQIWSKMMEVSAMQRVAERYNIGQTTEQVNKNKNADNDLRSANENQNPGFLGEVHTNPMVSVSAMGTPTTGSAHNSAVSSQEVKAQLEVLAELEGMKIISKAAVGQAKKRVLYNALQQFQTDNVLTNADIQAGRAALGPM